MADGIDRYIQIKKAAFAKIRRPIECFAIAAIDTSGDWYCGAEYGDSVNAAKAMLVNLEYISHELRQHIKRLEVKE